jgi:hypothetical protein
MRFIVRNLALILIVALLGVVAHGQNWPQFRGPSASGISEGKAVPRKWNAETGENLLWKTPIPGLRSRQSRCLG